MMLSSESEAQPTHIFFGGTFDPPHEGHRLVINQCLSVLADAKVVVVPAGHPAGAYGRHKQVETGFEDRFALCEIAFAAEIAQDQVRVDRIEQDMPTPNYSWATLEKLETIYPGSRWALLFGFDQLGSFSGWQKADQLVKRYDLIAIERPCFASIETLLPKLSESFGAVRVAGESCYKMASGKNLYAIRGSVSTAQSRLIRASFTEAVSSGWLNVNVLHYIREHKLYGVK